MKTPDLTDEWRIPLTPLFESPKAQRLSQFLSKELADGKAIYPPPSLIFRALELTAPQDVKVIILGQDPYHGPGQAEGLSFSVPRNTKIPPSLVNIFKELETDLEIPAAKHGHLIKWAEQGVLLLNSVLTVEAHNAASHANRGWEEFTDRVIEITSRGAPSVYFLWGAYAQKKANFIDESKHLVIRSPHPSPLSAHRGFLGSKPFSKANTYLIQNQRQPIDWRLE